MNAPNQGLLPARLRLGAAWQARHDSEARHRWEGRLARLAALHRHLRLSDYLVKGFGLLAGAALAILLQRALYAPQLPPTLATLLAAVAVCSALALPIAIALRAALRDRQFSLSRQCFLSGFFLHQIDERWVLVDRDTYTVVADWPPAPAHMP